jgi:hypothetical protein
MEQRSCYRGILWRSIAAAVVPFAVLSAYLFFSRWPSRGFTGFSDYVALAGSVAVGIVFIVILPIRPAARFVWSIIYVLSIPFLLVYYCFFFVGVVFGNWL